MAEASEREGVLPLATTRDIDRLIRTVNTGWVGRGFAIAFGMFLFSLIAGLLLLVLLSAAGLSIPTM